MTKIPNSNGARSWIRGSVCVGGGSANELEVLLYRDSAPRTLDSAHVRTSSQAGEDPS